MSAEVDTRVVQLTFDNEQFEKGVADSLKSLDKLSESIDELPKSAKSFEELNQAMNSLDDQGLNNIDTHLEKITDRLSTMGIVGAAALNKITSTAMDVAAGALGVVLDPIKQIFVGGLTRAQNLAQAQFLIAGMGIKDWKEEVDDVTISVKHLTEEEKALGQQTDSLYKDIDYAVSGTAYGLDEAAKVAAQFVASGVEIGDEMRGSLRAISGVAAMTNTSFQEIGDIFTKVAGNGKAMTMELNQLSSRGLNARAAIAEYLRDVKGMADATEQSVSEMAKKSEISFDIFASAMDYAFGEHAKEANNTFVGALANTRAALSRVGEQFWTPVMESARKVLVAVIPVINNLKNALAPFFTFVTSGIDMISDAIAALLNLISSIGAPIATALKNISNMMSNTISSFRSGIGGIFSTSKITVEAEKPIDKIGNALKTLVKSPSKSSDAVKKLFTDRGLSIEDSMDKAAESMEKSAKSTKKSAGKAGKAAKSASKSNKEAAKSFKEIIDSSPEIQVNAGKLEDVINNLVKVTGAEKSEIQDLAETAKKSGWDSKETLEKLNKISKGNTGLAEQIKTHLMAAGSSETKTIKYIDAVIDNLSQKTKIEKNALYDLLKMAAEKGWKDKDLLAKATELAKGDKELAKSLLEQLKAGAEAKTASLEETIKNVATVAGKDKSEVEKIVKLATEKGWDSTEVLEEAKKLANGNEDLAKQMLQHLQVAQAFGNNIAEEAAGASSAGGGAIGAAGGMALEVEEELNDATDKTKKNIEGAYESIIKTEQDVYDKYSELMKLKTSELKAFLDLKEDPEAYDAVLKDQFKTEKERKAFDKQINELNSELFHIKELSAITEKMNNMSADEEEKYRKILNLSAEDTEQVMFMRAKSVTDTAKTIDEVSEMLSRITGKEADVFKELAEVGRKHGFDSEEYLKAVSEVTKDLTTHTEELNDILTTSVELVAAHPLKRLVLSFGKVITEIGNTAGKFAQGLGNVATAISKTFVSPVISAFKKIRKEIATNTDSKPYKFIDRLADKFLNLSDSIRKVGDRFVSFTEKLIPSQEDIDKKAEKIVIRIKNLYRNIQEIGSTISKLFKTIKESKIFTTISEGLKTAGKGLKELFLTGSEKLSNKISDLTDKLINFKETVASLKDTKIYSRIKSGLNDIRTSAANTIDKIKNIGPINSAITNLQNEWGGFDNAVKTNSVWDWFTTKLSAVKTKFNIFVTWFKGTGITKFFVDMFDSIKAKFSPFTNAIAEDYEKLKNKLTNGEGIAGLIENIAESFEKLKEKVINFKFPTFEEFIESLHNLRTNFASFFTNADKTGVFDKISELFGKSKFVKLIKDYFNEFTQQLGSGVEQGNDALSGLKKFLNKAKEEFSDFYDWIKRSFSGKNAYEVARAIASLGIVFSFFRLLWELGDFIDVAGNSLSLALGDAKKKFLGIQIQSLLDSLGNAFLKVGVVMFAFSKSKPEEVQNAITILGYIGTFLGVAYVVLGAITKFSSGFDARAVSVATTAISGSLWLMASAIIKYKDMPYKDFRKGMDRIKETLLYLSISIGAMTLGPHTFRGLATTLIALAGGLWIIATVIERYFKMDPETFRVGFGRLNEVMYAVAAGVRAMRISTLEMVSSITDSAGALIHGKNYKGKGKGSAAGSVKDLALVLISFVGSLWILAKVIEKYAAIDDSVFTKGAKRVAAIAVPLMAFITALTFVANIGNGLSIDNIFGKNKNKDGDKPDTINVTTRFKGLAMTVIAIAGAILLMTPAIKILGDMETNTLIKGVAAVEALIVGVGLMLTALGWVGMNKDVRKNTVMEIFGIATVLAALATVFWLVGSWDADKLDKAATSIGIIESGLAAIVGALGYALRADVKNPGSFVAIVLGTAALMGVAAGLLWAIKELKLNEIQNAEGIILKGIIPLVGAMVGALELVSKFVKIDESVNVKALVGTIAGIILLFAGIAASLGIFAWLGGDKLDFTQILALSAGLFLLTGMFAGVAAVLSVIPKYDWKTFGTTVLPGIIAAGMIVSLSGLVLGGAAKIIGDNRNNLLQLSLSLGILSGVFTGLIAALGVLGPEVAGFGALGFIGVAFGIGVAIKLWEGMKVGEGVSNIIHDITAFLDPLGDRLRAFGIKMANAFTVLKDAFTDFKIDESVVTSLKALLDSFVALSTNSLYKDLGSEAISSLTSLSPIGGIVETVKSIFGGKDQPTKTEWEDFCDNLENLGRGLSKFAEVTKGINNEHLTEYAEAVAKIAGVNYPEKGFTKSFGDELESLATGFKKFINVLDYNLLGNTLFNFDETFKSVSNITDTIHTEASGYSWVSHDTKEVPSKIDMITQVIERLAGLVQVYSDLTTVVNDITNKNNGIYNDPMTLIGDGFESLGEGFMSFYNSVTAFETGSKTRRVLNEDGIALVETAEGLIEKLAAISIPHYEQSFFGKINNDLKNFGTGMTYLGDGIKNFMERLGAFESQTEEMTSSDGTGRVERITRKVGLFGDEAKGFAENALDIISRIAGIDIKVDPNALHFLSQQMGVVADGIVEFMESTDVIMQTMMYSGPNAGNIQYQKVFDNGLIYENALRAINILRDIASISVAMPDEYVQVDDPETIIGHYAAFASQLKALAEGVVVFAQTITSAKQVINKTIHTEENGYAWQSNDKSEISLFSEETKSLVSDVTGLIDDVAGIEIPDSSILYRLDDLFGDDDAGEYANFGKQIATLATGIKDFADTVKEVDYDNKSVMDALSIVTDITTAAVDERWNPAILTELGNTLTGYDTVTNIASVGFMTQWKNFIEGIGEGLGDDETKTNNAVKSIRMVLKAVKEIIDAFNGEGEGTIDIDDLKNKTTTLENLANVLKTLGEQAIGDFVTELAKGAEKINNLYQSFYDAAVNLGKAVKSGLKDSLVGKESGHTASGAVLSAEGEEGENDNTITGILTAFSNKFTETIQKDDIQTKFKDIGKAIAEGIMEGVLDYTKDSKFSKTVDDFITSLEKQFKAPEEEGGADINSPSKRFAKIGSSISEGVGKGMSDSIGFVTDAASTIVSSGLDSVSQAIADIANDDFSALSMDLTPVIAPTLDLSSVNASAAQMSSLFKDQQIAIQNAQIEADMKLTNQLAGAFDQLERPNVTNNVTVDGAENPNLWAQSFVNTMRREMRMANG